ncbi:hypothetical protein HaLaN_00361 [Haematococcus lacustris]|uniref:Secreted protein n=1 Tax=Haematococcus lacustris TaxID=44745 RepID=A0A699Y6Z8_HAELA|nr:hypothetical protein HaLaN_00361 [Haematococcus lacustris]
MVKPWLQGCQWAGLFAAVAAAHCGPGHKPKKAKKGVLRNVLEGVVAGVLEGALKGVLRVPAKGCITTPAQPHLIRFLLPTGLAGCVLAECFSDVQHTYHPVMQNHI